MTYDLTRPFQHALLSQDMHQSADLRFYWNHEMYSDFIENGVEHTWLVPVIQGFVGCYRTGTTTDPIEVTLVSRRSCYMAGTRYNARGIDDEGNVANFVESEQILEFRLSFFFFLQTRGSVPVFWQQTGVLSAPIDLTRSEDSTAPAFLKHFQMMLAAYRSVMIVNLLAQKRGEAQLTSAYNAQWERFRRQFGEAVTKFEFDYQKECKNGHHSNISSLLEKTHDILTYFGFGAVGALTCEQRGVPRINCLDCLDRTNVVMARLAWEALVQQFSVVQVPFHLNYDAVKDVDPHLKQFKNLWANNGDMLSKQYTGVGSVSSMVTRKGKKGISGMLSHGLKTVGRMLSAANGRNQAKIDMVLGSASPRGAEREELHVITVRICSWNLSGEPDPLLEDMQNWLIDPQLPFPQIVVVGLQEVVTSLLTSGIREIVQRWVNRVGGMLSRDGKNYRWVQSVDSLGCVISFFVLEELLPLITAVETDVIKPGLKRTLGKKGVVLLRLSLFDTSLCFINCCLPGGVGRVEERIRLLSKVHRKGFHKKRKVPSVADHDVKVLFGNLNFRIGLESGQIYSAIETRNYADLLRSDELVQFREKTEPLKAYTEGEITFPPTFKYCKKSHTYDGTKSSRPPAWCDRILYSGGGVQQVSYNRTESLHSCHRPVTSTLLIATSDVEELHQRQYEDREEVS